MSRMFRAGFCLCFMLFAVSAQAQNPFEKGAGNPPRRNPFESTPKPEPAETPTTPEETVPAEPVKPMPMPEPEVETTPPEASDDGLGGGKKEGTSWSVTTDAVKGAPTAGAQVQIPVPGLQGNVDARRERSRIRALFPATPSAIAAIGLNERETDVREVWDLARNEKVGVVTNVALEGSQLLAISPDGRYFAAKPQFDDFVVVIDVVSQKTIKKLPLTGIRLDLLAFRSGTQLLLGENERIQVFSMPDGKRERDIPLKGWIARDGWAMSAGGKYLAGIVRDGEHRNEVAIVDLESGQIAGQLKLAAGDAEGQGIAFSQDGARLVAAVETKSGVVLEIFDLPQPAVSAQIPVDAELMVDAENYQGPLLDWLPDGNRLLLAGRTIIDVANGTATTTLTDQLPFPIRTLSDEAYVSIQGQHLGTHGYGVEEPPAVVMPADAGSSEEPGNTPPVLSSGLPLTPPNRSSAKVIEPTGVIEWDVRLNAPPSYQEELDANGFRIPGGNIHQILLSSEEPPVAVASYASESLLESDGEDVKTWVETFSLQSGKSAGRLEFPHASIAMGISANGKVLAAVAANDRGRIDVWSLETDKHLASFRPGAGSAPWFIDFADADHLLVAMNDELSLWKLPECQAVYTMRIGMMRPVLSPAHCHIAVTAPDNSKVFVIESLTGTPRGTFSVAATSDEPVTAAGFHHRGRWLACVSTAAAGGELVVVDMASGLETVRTRLPISGDTLQWCGDDHLLLDGMSLVSLPSHAVIWTYEIPIGVHFRESVDARHWYVAANAASDRTYVVYGAKLPEDAVLRTIGSASISGEPVFKPGDPVSLDIQADANDPRSAGRLLVDHATKSYADAGSAVTADAKASFHIRPCEVKAATGAGARGTGPRMRTGHAPGRPGHVPGVAFRAGVPVLTPGRGHAAAQREPAAPLSNVWEMFLTVDEQTVWRAWVVGEGASARLESDESKATAATNADPGSVRAAVAAMLAIRPPRYGFVPGASAGIGQSRLTVSGPKQ